MNRKIMSGLILALIGLVWVGLAAAYQVPDTGQVLCYDDQGNVIDCPVQGQDFYGQDGNYSTNPPSYRSNGDGTVTDLNTGLMWQQSQGARRTWQGACEYCQDLTLGGYTDWRVPERRELLSIVDFGRYEPAINPIFSCIVAGYYWTLTADSPSALEAWQVYFKMGRYFKDEKSDSEYVRCVRSGN